MPSTVMPSASLPSTSDRPGCSAASSLARSRTAGVSSSSRHGGAHSPSAAVCQAALVGDLEEPDVLDRVAPELDPHRVLLGGREHVEDAAADGQLAAFLDQVGARVADVDQPDHDLVQVRVLAGPQPYRLKLAEAADDRLQQAADRGGDDRQRARPRRRRAVRAGRAGAARRSAARTCPSAATGARAAASPRAGSTAALGGGQQRVQRRGQVLGLAGGRGDGQHEPGGGGPGARPGAQPGAPVAGIGRAPALAWIAVALAGPARAAARTGRSAGGPTKSAPAVPATAGWLVSPPASSSARRSCGSSAMTERRPERLIASLHRQHEVPVPAGGGSPVAPSEPPGAGTRDLSSVRAARMAACPAERPRGDSLGYFAGRGASASTTRSDQRITLRFLTVSRHTSIYSTWLGSAVTICPV